MLGVRIALTLERLEKRLLLSNGLVPGTGTSQHGDQDLSFEYAIEPRYAVGDEPDTVIAADFDSDGHFDLAAANESSDNVSVLLSQKRGR